MIDCHHFLLSVLLLEVSEERSRRWKKNVLERWYWDHRQTGGQARPAGKRDRRQSDAIEMTIQEWAVDPFKSGTCGVGVGGGGVAEELVVVK